jgi:Zn-dependent protease with chaperone function
MYPLGPKSPTLLAVLLLGLSLGTAAQTRYVRQEPDGRLAPDTSSVKTSPQEQIKLGRQAATQVERQYPMLPDSSPVTQFVQQLGNRLAAAAPGYKWPFEFHVINQKEINAFALPGGPIFVNLGTIQAADNEAQLAGVMAHEIGHVVMMHSARAAAETRPYQIAGALGSAIIGGLFGGTVIGQLGQLGIQLGAGGVIMKYSRTAETEADLMGAQIMYDAGFNPRAMLTFFDKLKQQGGSGVPQFLSDHPDPGDRVQSIQKVIARFPPKKYVLDSPQYQQVRQDALKVHAYSAREIAQRQRSGGRVSEVRAADISPAGGMRQLNQPGFSISYPANWQVVGDSQGNSIVIAPPSGITRDQIAYGVSIGTAQGNNGQSFDQITQEILSTLQRNNPDMRTIGNPRRIRVNGLAGRSVDLSGVSPLQLQPGQPTEEHDWLVALPRSDGSALFVVYTAPQQDFTKLRPTFEEMLRSLQMR